MKRKKYLTWIIALGSLFSGNLIADEHPQIPLNAEAALASKALSESLDQADQSTHITLVTRPKQNSLALEKDFPRTDDVMMPNVAQAPEGIPLSLQDAIVFMLQHQLTIEIAQLNIVLQEGNLQSAAGPFDYYMTASELYTDEHNLLNGTLKSSKKGKEIITAFTAVKATRIGTSFAFAATSDKVKNPFNLPTPQNNGTISFLITQPLLRGFLNGVNWMNEIAAEYELYATYYDTFQTISQNVLNVVNSYWASVGASLAVGIQEEGLKRLDDLAFKIEELIDNNQLSGDQINQVQQQLLNYEQALVSAEQTLYNTVEQLKLAMGDFSVSDPLDDPYDLADTFPLPPFDKMTFEKQFEDYIQYSLNHRYDIMASILRQREALYALKGAKNDTLPTLNVVGGVTDLDIASGSNGKPILASLEMKKPQTNWIVGVSLAFPLYNDQYVGAYVASRAKYTQALLNSELLEQQAISALRQALSQQITISMQLQEAEENVKISKIVFEENLLKLRAGLVSLFDLLSFESSLTSALLNRVTIRQQYMQNIILLRFLTSTIFYQNEDGQIVVQDIENFPAMRISEEKKPLNRRLIQRAQERARVRAERIKQRSRNREGCNCSEHESMYTSELEKVKQ